MSGTAINTTFDPVKLRAIHMPVSLIDRNRVFENGRVVYGKDNLGNTISHKIGNGLTSYTLLPELLLPTGGNANQILSKVDSTNFKVVWKDNSFANLSGEPGDNANMATILASKADTNTVNASFYPLNSNPAGYLTPASAATVYYPLSTNPAGYLTGITGSQVNSALGYAPENPANKGIANGYVPLNNSLKIDAAYLPSYVSDIITASTFSTLPTFGTAGFLYITADTNYEYRWNAGTNAYIQLVASPGTTDALAEGVSNLYYTNARVKTYADTLYYPLSNPAAYITRASLSATSPVLYDPSTGIVSLQAASASQNGYLSSVDWNTFNNKQPALTAVNANFGLMGPVSGTAAIPSFRALVANDIPGTLNSTIISGNVSANSFIKSGGTSVQFLKADGSIDSTNYESSLTLPQVGQIISDNFVRASVGANYTAAGTGVTYSIVSNSLQIVNSNSSFANTNYLLYNVYGKSNFESFTTSVNIIPAAITSTSFGAGFVFKSGSAFHYSLTITLCLDTTNLGKIRFDGLDNVTGTSQSNVIIGISAGDNLLMTAKFIKSKFVVTVKNVSTGRSGTCELDISTAFQVGSSSVFGLINSFQYGLISTGGTQTLNNWTVIANDYKNVDYLLVGDSIYKGCYTDNILTRWGEQVNDVCNVITQTLAGPGNFIIDQNISEILSLAPKNIIIGLGINDITSGSYSDAQIQANYASLISSLVSSGYVVGTNLFLAALLPTNISTNNTKVITFNNWLFTTYGAAVIDTYTSFYGTLGTPFNTIYTFDGLHPNKLGHSLYADIVIGKLNISAAKKKKGNYFPVLYNANGLVTIGDLSLNSVTPRYQLEVLNSSSGQQGIHINNSSVDSGLYLSSNNGFSIVASNVAIGSGGNYIAKDTGVSGILIQKGLTQFFNNTGLTPGGIFTPVASLYGTGGQWKFGASFIGPRAIVHISPGGTAANSAAFKIDPGSLLTTPESGAFEFNGTDLFYTTSTPTRRTVANLDASQIFTNKIFGDKIQINGSASGSAIIKTPAAAGTPTFTLPATVGTAGQVMTTDGSVNGILSWTTPYINPMTTLGDIIYGGAAGAATRLPGNTTTVQLFLTQTGTGTASAAPAYFDLFGTANTFSAVQTFTNDVTIGGYLSAGNSGRFGGGANYINYGVGINTSSVPIVYWVFNYNGTAAFFSNAGNSLTDYQNQNDFLFGSVNNIGISAGGGSQVSVYAQFMAASKSFILNGGNGSGFTDNPSAIFQMYSTTKGMLPPVMSTAQKNAIAAPAEGLVLYDNSLHSLQVYNGTAWTSSGSGGSSAGVPAGGTTGQILAKNSNTDYDDHWIDPPSGGSSIPPVSTGEKVVTQTATGAHVDYDLEEQVVSASSLSTADFSTGVATIAGDIGQIAYDANYKYECTGVNQWIRIFLNVQSIDLYLADIDDSGGDKTSTQLNSAYPGSLVGQQVWGTNNLYIKKTSSVWKKIVAINA